MIVVFSFFPHSPFVRFLSLNDLFSSTRGATLPGGTTRVVFLCTTSRYVGLERPDDWGEPLTSLSLPSSTPSTVAEPEVITPSSQDFTYLETVLTLSRLTHPVGRRGGVTPTNKDLFSSRCSSLRSLTQTPRRLRPR